MKNKLDDCLYAIKCIQLSKKNKILNKKITREVKLLSRLNHENVVRYFNSWIETAKASEEGTPLKNVGKSVNNIYLYINFMLISLKLILLICLLHILSFFNLDIFDIKI